MKVGPSVILTHTARGLAGKVGCVRGQALPCMEGATRLSRKIFPKKKKTLGAIWGIPLQQQLQSLLHPNTRQQTVCTSSQRELRLQASPRGGYPVTRSTPNDRGVCPSTRECLHLISEGTETTGTRESANQGSLCSHTHSPEEAYHKKEWVEAWITRIPPGRGNPPTKETPTDKKRRR